VCQWRWESWTEDITGTCVPSNGGVGEAEECDGVTVYCEADLVCAVGVYGNRECHRDCKLYANSLGCITGQKCISLELEDDPKKGMCQLKNPPPPPAEEVPPPTPGDPTTPDPPDGAGPGVEPPVSNGGVVVDDDSTIPDGEVDADGDSAGCSGGTGQTSSVLWILGLLFLWGRARDRRAAHSVLSRP
jgi:hypothetical protein